MISNQSRGLNKGPGRLSQMSMRGREYALMQFGFFAGRAQTALRHARILHADNPIYRKFDLENARQDGQSARAWFDVATEQEVGA